MPKIPSQQADAGHIPFLATLRAVLDRFCPLGEAEWQELSESFVYKIWPKGTFLTREGQVEHYIYFLASGATRNYFTRGSNDFTVDFHFSGEFVTAYYSFITREPSAIWIELLEESQTVAISQTSLLAFYARYPHAERIGRLMAEYQYVRRLHREMDLMSRTAEERYAALMAKQPDLVAKISVKHLSSFLGIQPESLSRIRKLYGKY